ncbi:hypothetical protein DAPPUDRAFT_332539 [Daphnia pulex]|uniref:Uncharacterized protein n=1 Tax=Daphnia pulex TaxID=6669 RepID=E9HQ90_DAPPU|nr:hypothetical protein DAPPUDRAFT_332539 [Daphnia pulex]|eukprot:EFX66081.1 hypothetical protein DAPPUDRAFT_332539 [Daphnia pulex]
MFDKGAVRIVEPIIEEPSSIVPSSQQSLVSVVRHEDAIDQDFGSAPEDFLMKWSGYAGTKMNIALRKFQVQALTALHFSRDIIIVEVTDSGNSTCFQLPMLMLKDEEFCLVIVQYPPKKSECDLLSKSPLSILQGTVLGF